jgi:hypothetical protein
MLKYFIYESKRLYINGLANYMDSWNIIALVSILINLSYIIILLKETKSDDIDPRMK